MTKRGAAIVFAVFACMLTVFACTLVAYAQNPSQKGSPQDRPCFCESDVTGAIGDGAQPQGGDPAIEPGRLSESFPQVKATDAYEEAYRNWRGCAATHQGVGNPPPQCEQLRQALRRAIGARPRSETSR
jgi:hypothetical protein